MPQPRHPGRSRLSYQVFAEFLSLIKELNAGRAGRDETLLRAQRLFSAGNEDLYALFDALLSRHAVA